MKEEHLLLLSGIWKFINQVVLIDYIIIIQGGGCMAENIFVGVLIVIAVGATIFGWWLENGGKK